LRQPSTPSSAEKRRKQKPKANRKRETWKREKNAAGNGGDPTEESDNHPKTSMNSRNKNDIRYQRQNDSTTSCYEGLRGWL
jgi:hypothetical protein